MHCCTRFGCFFITCTNISLPKGTTDNSFAMVPILMIHYRCKLLFECLALWNVASMASALLLLPLVHWVRYPFAPIRDPFANRFHPGGTTGAPASTTALGVTTGVPASTTGIPASTTAPLAQTTGVQSSTTGAAAPTTGVVSTTGSTPVCWNCVHANATCALLCSSNFMVILRPLHISAGSFQTWQNHP
jgi:hypothetical protein